MTELSVEEFQWNLKRLLREGYPQGIPVGDLSSTYSYWLRTTLVEPNSIIPGCQTWGVAFEVNVLLKETFMISSDTIPYVKIRGTNEESEEELNEVLEMVKYSKVVMMRAERQSSHEYSNETVPAEISGNGSLDRESKETDAKKPSTCTNNADKNSTKSTKHLEEEIQQATEKKYSPLLDDNENASKSCDSLAFSDDDEDPSMESTTGVGKTLSDKYSIGSAQQSNNLDRELPSSIIRTPDFDESSSPFQPIMKTTLVMPELGRFNATICNVSHDHVEGVIFPKSPVSIVGRISHDNVWDYISKMKKNKELIIFRLAPAESSDVEVYMSVFNYLTARRRFGVLGGIISPLKDVYLIPQHRSSPLNKKLLPIDGPGLPVDRSHSLLAVVARHIIEPPIKTKRHCVPTVEDIPFKIPKSGALKTFKTVPLKSVDSVDSPNIKLQIGETPYIPLAIGNYIRKDEKIRMGEGLKSTNDVPVGAKPKTQAELLMEELNAQIEKERQEIESMTAAISKNGHGKETGAQGPVIHLGIDDDTSVPEYVP